MNCGLCPDLYPWHVMFTTHHFEVDWRTHQGFLQLQERLARSPTFPYDSNVIITNILEEYKELLYAYLYYWEARMLSLYSWSCFRLLILIDSCPIVSSAASPRTSPAKSKDLMDIFISSMFEKEVVL